MYGKKLYVAGLMILTPALLHATRGPDDYGLAMALMMMFWSIPAGLVLTGFIIYLAVTLKGESRPPAGKGKAVFVVSIVLAVFSVIIPLLWMQRGKWHPTMIGLMCADFIPVLALCAVAAWMALLVKKRSLMSDEEYARVNQNREKMKDLLWQKKKIILVVSAAAVLVFAAITFRYCFM